MSTLFSSLVLFTLTRARQPKSIERAGIFLICFFFGLIFWRLFFFLSCINIPTAAWLIEFPPQEGWTKRGLRTEQRREKLFSGRMIEPHLVFRYQIIACQHTTSLTGISLHQDHKPSVMWDRRKFRVQSLEMNRCYLPWRIFFLWFFFLFFMWIEVVWGSLGV